MKLDRSLVESRLEAGRHNPEVGTSLDVEAVRRVTVVVGSLWVVRHMVRGRERGMVVVGILGEDSLPEEVDSLEEEDNEVDRMVVDLVEEVDMDILVVVEDMADVVVDIDLVGLQQAEGIQAAVEVVRMAVDRRAIVVVVVHKVVVEAEGILPVGDSCRVVVVVGGIQVPTFW